MVILCLAVDLYWVRIIIPLLGCIEYRLVNRLAARSKLHAVNSQSDNFMLAKEYNLLFEHFINLELGVLQIQSHII